MPALGLCFERYFFAFLSLAGADGSKLKIDSLMLDAQRLEQTINKQQQERNDKCDVFI